MFYILNNSKSGMIAQQQKLDIISNNMVNVNTHGYKKLEGSFANLFYRDLNVNGVPTSGNDAILGSGVKLSSVTRSRTQGNLQSTGLNTDLAIDGDGFFRITNSNGEISYIRSGALNVDIFGRLTDKDGNFIEVTYNEGIDPLNTGLTSTNMIVDRNGNLSTSNGIEIGKINFYDAVGSNAMISQGDNKYVPINDGIIMFQVSPDVYQNHLEMSNVDTAEEMTDMILTQRAYQMASKGVTTADEMWSMLNNLR